MMPSSSGGLGHWNIFIMTPMPIKTSIIGMASQLVIVITPVRKVIGTMTPPTNG